MHIQWNMLFSKVMSDSLQPHGLQHAWLLSSSPSPRVCSDSCPSSQWCYLTILSSAIPYSCCLQSFPEAVSFPMSCLFTSGGQRTGASASASVLPMNIQGCVPLGWTGLIFLLYKDSQESSPGPQFESINSSALSHVYGPTLTSIHD